MAGMFRLTSADRIGKWLHEWNKYFKRCRKELLFSAAFHFLRFANQNNSVFFGRKNTVVCSCSTPFEIV
ncbi:MAG: hypothetical protein DYG98_02845 [Haliscomenobacteraceae bacterium CHB4]|nr:hypothetical protein [Haliscomenobacteraceae bacterium CHB4]